MTPAAEGRKKARRKPGPLLVVSGGAGISGEQVARVAIAQFRDVEIPVIVIPAVTTREQIEQAVQRAAASQGTIIHTLVNAELRHAIIRLAREKNVVAIDLLGHLLSRLTEAVGHPPLGQPGLYRQLRQAYFDRIDAIEFTVAHDDGRKPEDLAQAEIVLTGPSRVGKTPLSMYLSVLGWKVANVPLVRGVPPPAELDRIDRRRVVGVTISPAQLLAHRRRRQRSLGAGSLTSYSDAVLLNEEVEEAVLFFRSHRFPVIDVTDKPIEESAEEVIALITRQMASTG